MRQDHFTRGGLAKIVILASLLAYLYGRIAADMAYDWWNDPTASQGLVIPPLAIFVAWLVRREILSRPPVPNAWGYIVTGLGCVLLLLGKYAAEFFLQRISLIVVLAGITLTFWGFARLRSLAFSLLLLATMVPLPTLVLNTVALPLQLLASRMAAEIARVLGVTVFQEGNVIHLAGATLGVEEACSGLSALSALLVASLLIGFLVGQRPSARLALFLLALPIAIGVNIVRVAGSAVLADYDAKLATGFYHSFSGWLVFVIGSVTLIGAARIIQILSPAEGRKC